MARVGVEAARVEDIVGAAGVAWGSFYRYFPAKEDVFLEAAAGVAEVLADAAAVAAEAGLPAADAVIGAFWRANQAAPSAPPLWEATFAALADRAERLGEILDAREVAPPHQVLTELLERGQRSGELRADVSAPQVAGVILAAVWANARQEGPVALVGRRPVGGSGGRTTQRALAASLLIDGLRVVPPGPARQGAAPAERIGRRWGPAEQDPDI